MELLDLCPIGHVIETTDTSFDPNTSIGGTWALNSATDSVIVSQDESDTDFSTVGNTGGASTVTLATTNLPAHTHTCRGGFILTGNRSAGYTWGSLKVNASWGLWSGYINNGGTYDGYGQGTITWPSTGSGGAHNNMCAYKVVNRWIRTA